MGPDALPQACADGRIKIYEVINDEENYG